ncbi:MAG: LamG domain-containing protein [Bacteroidales bacterium]|jgi:hypothetical protein|nr:LamG domain-containing protein [Bacteroidales bacterium]
MKKILNIIAVISVLAAFQSCSQDLHQHPAFNYPERTPVGGKDLPEGCIMHMSFDDTTLTVQGDDAMAYTYNGKTPELTDGISGKAYQGKDGNAIMINPMLELTRALKNLGSFTYTAWIKYDGGNSASCALFALSDPDKYFANIDLFIEGNTTTNFYFKGYFNSNNGEKWLDRGNDAKVPLNDIAGKWTQIGLVYDATISTARIYINGTELCEGAFTGFGELTFNAIGKMVLGAHPAMTGITSDTTSWPASGSFYTGAMDELYLYNKALTSDQIAAQYNSQKS